MNLNIFCLFIISTAFATATTLSPFSHQPVKASKNYEEEIDKFDDAREASYVGS